MTILGKLDFAIFFQFIDANLLSPQLLVTSQMFLEPPEFKSFSYDPDG
jgi:hypothetical protein